jgi:hypothetical protein
MFENIGDVPDLPKLVSLFRPETMIERILIQDLGRTQAQVQVQIDLGRDVVLWRPWQNWPWTYRSAKC